MALSHPSPDRFLLVLVAMLALSGRALADFNATYEGESVSDALLSNGYTEYEKLIATADVAEFNKLNGNQAASDENTFFAFTDEAYNSLPSGTKKKLQDPKYAAEVLAYSVTVKYLPRDYINSQVTTSTPLKTPTFYTGKELTLTSKDNDFYLNGAKIVLFDMLADGYSAVHGIEAVLFPPGKASSFPAWAIAIVILAVLAAMAVVGICIYWRFLIKKRQAADKVSQGFTHGHQPQYLGDQYPHQQV